MSCPLRPEGWIWRGREQSQRVLRNTRYAIRSPRNPNKIAKIILSRESLRPKLVGIDRLLCWRLRDFKVVGQAVGARIRTLVPLDSIASQAWPQDTVVNQDATNLAAAVKDVEARTYDVADG